MQKLIEWLFEMHEKGEKTFAGMQTLIERIVQRGSQFDLGLLLNGYH